MHIKFTYVDSVTQISVETEPARNGPSFPRIKGLNNFVNLPLGAEIIKEYWI
jgi:hypothetical protein